MRSLRFAVRALTLSLTLTAAGAFCVAAPASAVDTTQAGNPVGGQQLGAAGVIVNLAPGVPPPPAMPGASFLLADMDTGQILAARAPHALHLPASTLKALTALTLIPLMDANAKILVKPEDVRADGTHVGILAGTSYSVGTLLQGMLITSGNDAAYALARGNKSAAATLQQMNALAADLGAADTVARDPSGLDKAGQQTSAYDLALIGRAGMRLPDFRRYVGTKQASLPGGRSADGKLKPGFKISNHNTLLHNYQGAIGIKNGYTVAAKFTYIEAATRGGKTYLLTEMASPQGSWRPAAAMLDWAFAHGSSLTPIGALVEPGEPAAAKPTVAAAVISRAPPARSQARPTRSARPPAITPWIGVAGGLGALALAWSFVRRNTVPRTSRRRR
jgi:D-alanyl-D-alanine carboxypeptidase (penicillin-binding protein 5/6)